MIKIKISDWLSGKMVWESYLLLNKTQWYSRTEMESFQIQKLKKLLKYCHENIPYYQNIIKDDNIDIENFNSLSILEKFPILTKEIIQENYSDFYPLSNKNIKGVKISQTGGTTGNILIKRNDANTRSMIWGSFLRFKKWMGISSKDKVLILMGGHVKKVNLKSKLIASFKARLNNTITVNIYDTSDETVDKVIALLQKHRFGLIRSYPQFLFSVARKVDKLGLKFKVKAITTTAEPVLLEHRDLFRKVFGAEVFDQFGCGEIGGVAYECDHHNGLHITEERVIIEVTEKNDLLITDLDNFTMPFIRYWNADQAIISNDLCSCGRESKLIKHVLGRTCDYILGQNGEFLHWAYFWHLIFDSEIALKRSIKKFQIIQSDLLTLEILLVADKLDKMEEAFLIDDIKKRISDIHVVISYHNSIENSSTGKYRPVINKLLI